MKKTILLICLLFIWQNNSAQEKIPPIPQQRNGPPDTTNPCDGTGVTDPLNPFAPCAPIDDNITIYILLAAGLVYGVKKIKKKQLT